LLPSSFFLFSMLSQFPCPATFLSFPLFSSPGPLPLYCRSPFLLPLKAAPEKTDRGLSERGKLPRHFLDMLSPGNVFGGNCRVVSNPDRPDVLDSDKAGATWSNVVTCSSTSRAYYMRRLRCTRSCKLRRTGDSKHLPSVSSHIY